MRRGIAVALGSALAAFALAALPAGAAASPPALWQRCGGGAGDIGCGILRGVATAPASAPATAGDVYLADQTNKEIYAFSPFGTFLRSWGWDVVASGPDESGTGFEICVPASGDVCKAGVAGPGAGQFAVASGPQGVAVDSAGNVYVVDMLNQRVQKFDPEGHFLRMWGGGVVNGGAEGTGAVSDGSATIAEVATTKKAFSAGQTIAGADIQPNTTIVEVKASELVLSKPAAGGACGAPCAGTTLTVAAGAGNVATNEKQTLTVTGATAGNFQLAFTAPKPQSVAIEQTTANIPFNATTAQVKGALEALSNIGAGNVEVTLNAGGNAGGGIAPGGPWTIEFKGTRYADTDVAALEARPGSPEPLVGGAAGVAVAQQGASAAETCTAAASCQAGVAGAANGQFEWSVVGSYIAVGPSNKVWVGDKGRIQQFSSEGAYQSQIALGASEKAKALAVDSAGNVYAAIQEGENNVKDNVRKWKSNGEEQPKVELKAPQALAVDTAKDLYAVSGEVRPTIVKFNPSGVEQESWGQEEPPAPKLTSPPLGLTGLAAGSGCLTSGADVYAVSGTPLLRAYGPTPSKSTPASCEKPAKAPEIAAQYALSVGSSEATLGAQIDPRFWGNTTYYAQYATAACVEAGGWEAGCVAKKPPAPAPGLPLGAEGDFTAPTAALFVDGLSPDTDYRFRFAAQSGGGGPVFGVGGEVGSDGAEGSFHTATHPSGSPGPDPCPNASYRTGPGALLPDCRAYEMVSPVDKGGGDILAFETSLFRPAALDQSADSGDKLTYSSFQAFGDAQSTPYSSQYIATREEGVGWSSEAISPPRGALINAGIGQNDTEFKAFSGDLCSAWLARDLTTAPPLPAGGFAGLPNLYRRSNCGGEGYEWLGGGELGPSTPPELQGLSADGSRAIFRTEEHLAQDAATALGSKLRCLSATEATTLSYRWLRDGLPITGATSPTYTTSASSTTTPPSSTGDAGAEIQCQATATNANAGETTIANPAWVIAPYPATAPPRAPSQMPAPSASEPPAVGGPGGQTLSCDPGAWEGSPGFEYRWYRNGAALAGASEPTYTLTAPDLASAAAFQCEAIAADAGGTVAAVSAAALSVPAPSSPATPIATAVSAGANGFDASLYESDDEGDLKTVCVLPSGVQSNTCSAGTMASGIWDGRSASVTHALSEDGATVFFSDASLGAGRIYARVGGEQTLAVSEAAGSGPATFWGAAADGSRAIFSLGEPGAGSVASADLYEYETGSEEARPIADKVAGVVGMSEDATRVYLVSAEACGGENEEGRSPVEGAPNLYLYEAGESCGAGELDFVGTLTGADAVANTRNEGGFFPTPVNVEPYLHTARVSPSGETVAFTSAAPLPTHGRPGGYDNTDAASGKADAEVYRYEAGAGRLECVSCDPSGARPAGRNANTAGTPAEQAAHPFWAAALIGGAENQLFYPRNLSADGSRLFFESFDALSPRDTNGAEDVYEWEAVGAGPEQARCSESSPAYSPPNGGCLSLISTGESPLDSQFVDASPGGGDAFIRTAQSLVGSDPGQFDLYDARVGGGLPEPQPVPACEGDACQSPPPAPARPTPASAAFQGPGNLAPAPAKHKHKKKHKKKKKGKAHKGKHRGQNHRGARR